MALTSAQMLTALHKADPSTLNKRYTDKELLAAYTKAVAPKTATPPTGTTAAPKPTNGWNEAASNELKKLNEIEKPTATQTARIAELKGLKAGAPASTPPAGSAGSTPPPVTTPAPTTPAPPTEEKPAEVPLDEAKNPLASSITSTGGIIPDDQVERLRQQTQLGEDFGNSVIKSQGLEGDFLGRIDEGPSAAALDAIERSRQLANNAGTLSPIEQEAIDRNRAALEGFNAQENTALRENSEAGLDSTMQTLMRKQAGMNAASGIQGNASAARYNPIYRERLGQGRGLERDILVANIAEKARARGAFTDLVTGRADETFRRQGSANAAYAGNTQVADAFTRGGQQANTEYGAREKATRVGTILGGVGTVGNVLGGFSAEDFQKKAFEESQAAQAESERRQLEFAEKALKTQESIYSKLNK